MAKIGVFAAIFDEERRIFLVRMAYGNHSWTTPGGALGAGETIEEGLKREVFEETGFRIEPGSIIGVYSKPSENEVVIFVEATIIDRKAWQPNDEISEVGFFAESDLPTPMNPRPRLRIEDAFCGERGILRSF